MAIWFTADTHFGHANIIKYCHRPFLSPAERAAVRDNPRGKTRISPDTVHRHDEALLSAINSRVQDTDTLWVLGDFSMGSLADAREYRDRIVCRDVNLVWGNHDDRSIRPLFGSAIEQGMITVEGQPIWLNHYPMRSWNCSFHGSWQLYGHVHGRLESDDASRPWVLTKDVGVDACDYRPWSFDDLCAYMAPRIDEFHRRKAGFGDAELT